MLITTLFFLMCMSGGNGWATEDGGESAPFIVTLCDGTTVLADEVAEHGTDLYVRLTDGRMFAYSKTDIHDIHSGAVSREESPDQTEETTVSPAPTNHTTGPISRSSTLGAVAGGIKIKISPGDEISLSGSIALEDDGMQGRHVQSDNDMGDLIQRQKEEHQAALWEYEDQLLDLAEKRDELIEKDYQASRACSGFQTVIGTGRVSLTNQYGGFWSGTFSWVGLMDNYSSPACQAILADCDRLSFEVLYGLDDLATFARQNGILPGEARAKLNEYALNVR